jgi:hypothetical protein
MHIPYSQNMLIYYIFDELRLGFGVIIREIAPFYDARPSLGQLSRDNPDNPYFSIEAL